MTAATSEWTGLMEATTLTSARAEIPKNTNSKKPRAKNFVQRIIVVVKS